jgi:hypothetical protein
MRLRLELVSLLMQVDLLMAEGECHSSLSEADAFHAEHLRVEGDGCRNVLNGQDQMIEVGDHERKENLRVSMKNPRRACQRGFRDTVCFSGRGFQ